MLFCIASTIPRSMSVKSSTLFCRIAYIVSTYFLCLDTYDYVYACYINYIQTLATTYHIICVCKRILESNVGRIILTYYAKDLNIVAGGHGQQGLVTEDGATKMSNNSIGKDLTPDGEFHP